MLTVLRSFLAATFVSLLALAVFWQPGASAQVYGEDPYGSCTYSGCPATPTTPTTPTTPPPTIVTTPGGLDIAINLEDGQTIPYEGYEITVTPLNGQGTSFDQVDFYVDGNLVHSATPDETGTVRWFWDPAEYPGSVIKIVVTADGTTITREFRVQVEDRPTGNTETPGRTSSDDDPAGFFERGIERMEKFIASLPRIVVRTFPYILFIPLIINLFILFSHSRRELEEYLATKRWLARERQLVSAKRDFIDLTSHYLRTPLTVIRGGIDLLADVHDTTTATLRTHADSLSRRIENLIAVSRSTEEKAVVMTGQTAGTLHFWQRPGLFVPLIFVGLVCFAFDYLAVHGGAMSDATIELSLQILIFLTIAVLTYVLFRDWQLKRRDAKEIQRIAQAEAADTKARDDLMDGLTTDLHRDLAKLEQATTGVGADAALKFIKDGEQRFDTLLTKCVIAAGLKSAHSSGAWHSVALNDLIQAAQKPATTKATARDVTIATHADQALSVHDPSKLQLVFENLIDNAVSYSPGQDTVSVTAKTTAAGTTVSVTDHGQGIPEDRLAELGKPFVKAEGAEQFNHEGPGLSLYLDKLIMAYLGGSLTIESSPGQGTTAKVFIPAQP